MADKINVQLMSNYTAINVGEAINLCDFRAIISVSSVGDQIAPFLSVH